MNDMAATIASTLRLTPQAKTILSHLRNRESITPMEALVTYSISRLASCIGEIRKAGFTVDMTMSRDERLHKFGRYSLKSVH